MQVNAVFRSNNVKNRISKPLRITFCSLSNYRSYFGISSTNFVHMPDATWEMEFSLYVLLSTLCIKTNVPTWLSLLFTKQCRNFVLQI